MSLSEPCAELAEHTVSFAICKPSHLLSRAKKSHLTSLNAIFFTKTIQKPQIIHRREHKQIIQIGYLLFCSHVNCV